MISIEPIPLSSWQPLVEQFVLRQGMPKANEIVHPWTQGAPVAQVDTFNDATISLFLDFAGELEGYQNTDGTGSGSRWRNLPYWLAGIWLPLNGKPIIPEVVTIGNEPLMIATAPGLRRDLDEIRHMSMKLKLGEKPELFDTMLYDPKGLYALTSTKTFSESESVAWIWYAYSWVANKAIEVSVPAWQGG